MKRPLCIWIIFLFFSGILSQVNTESYRLKSDSNSFSVVAELELSIMAGNTDFQHFGSDSRINYNWTTDNYTFVIMNGGFDRENGKTFFSQALFHLRYVNGLNRSLSLEMFIQYDNDKSLLLLNRYLAGAGLRYKLIDRDNVSSRLGVSLFWEQEAYNLSSVAQHARLTKKIRLSSYMTFNKKISDNVTLLSISYIQPDIRAADDLRILSDNALNISLSKATSLNIKLDGRYDSDPADTIKKYDLSSKIGLVIDFN